MTLIERIKGFDLWWSATTSWSYSYESIRTPKIDNADKEFDSPTDKAENTEVYLGVKFAGHSEDTIFRCIECVLESIQMNETVSDSVNRILKEVIDEIKGTNNE